MSNVDENDLKLIHDYQNGNEDAFTLLFHKYYPIVCKIFMMKGVSQADSDDMTEEIFIKLITGLKSYHFDKNFDHYLNKIVRNKLIDYYRKSRRTCSFFEEQFIQDKSFDPINLEELHDIIECCLQKIIDKIRRSILLLWIEGFKRAQMAELLNIPLGTVHSNLERGKIILRKCVEDSLK
ncbi:sigma-70 family RNA polymerase sigma factor [candidate division KSB1 bacterium]|nr:sigma-70 family RNA polymerase sigma factor [candidate division KSB1 bacterium]